MMLLVAVVFGLLSSFAGSRGAPEWLQTGIQLAGTAVLGAYVAREWAR